MAGEKLDYNLLVLIVILIARNLLFQEGVYQTYKFKDFFKAMMLFIRIFEPEMMEPGKPLMRQTILNYVRQLPNFLAKQFMYYGYIFEPTEFIIYIVMVPILTRLARELPREYFIRGRYFIAYLQFERKMYYGYRLILALNDIETLFNNKVNAAFMLFWMESCSMLTAGVIEGLIWGRWGLNQVGNYLWQGLRDYRYGAVILLMLEHFFVNEAKIKFAIPLFPPTDIFRRKLIQGWHCLDYHDHYFAYFVMFLVFSSISVLKQSGFVAKMDHEDHENQEKRKKKDNHDKKDQLDKHDKKPKKDESNSKTINFSLLHYLRSRLTNLLMPHQREPVQPEPVQSKPVQPEPVKLKEE